MNALLRESGGSSVKIRCESNPNSNLSSALILEDYFHEIDALKVDLTKPWWNENVMESLTFAGKTYSLASDASIMMWEASLCFMFNKTMSADLKLAARGLNGSTERETEDAWGLTANLRLMSCLLISGGETIVGTDKDGLPAFDGLTPAMTDKFERNSTNYLMEKPGKKMYYALDSGYFLDETFAALQAAALDTLIMECTNPILDRSVSGKRDGHMDYFTAMDTLAELYRLGAITASTQVYFTHISPNETTHAELAAHLAALDTPYRITAAWDGMEI